MRSRSRGSGHCAVGGLGDADRGDSGSVTAEFAALVPAVLLVLAFCLGGVQLVAQQVRLTDAAADAARSIARGDGRAQAANRVRTSVGDARMTTHSEGDFVCVGLVSEAAFAPGAAVGMTVGAHGCALGTAGGDAAAPGAGGGGP